MHSDKLWNIDTQTDRHVERQTDRYLPEKSIKQRWSNRRFKNNIENEISFPKCLIWWVADESPLALGWRKWTNCQSLPYKLSRRVHSLTVLTHSLARSLNDWLTDGRTHSLNHQTIFQNSNQACHPSTQKRPTHSLALNLFSLHSSKSHVRIHGSHKIYASYVT